MINDTDRGADCSTAPRKSLLALAGKYQNGKSTFLNCLLGGMYALEGDGTVTTKHIAKYTYGEYREAKLFLPDGTIQVLSSPMPDQIPKQEKGSTIQVSVYSPVLMKMDILDSPGCGASKTDDREAREAVTYADMVIYVIQKELDFEDVSFLKDITEHNKYYTVILNCLDEKAPDDADAKQICNAVMAKITTEHLDRNYLPLSKEKQVYPVNLLWAQCALGYLPELEHRRKRNKIKNFMEQDNITPLSLLEKSGFLSLRSVLTNLVALSYNIPSASMLSLASGITEEWTSELLKTIKGI